MIIKLSNDTVFREEKGYILLCVCNRLQFFKLSKKYLSFLNAIKKGLEENTISSKHKLLVADLKDIEAIVVKGQK